ncbi:MAG: hypothetical protein L0211_16580 [Planctomycetaceae bacterium]|nr:hypothetical protein [Planctomycetaceae bacterium]
MEPMQLHARVGGDGVLRLDVPFEPSEAGRDVLVKIEPAPQTAPSGNRPSWGGFLAETFGTGDAPAEKGST